MKNNKEIHAAVFTQDDQRFFVKARAYDMQSDTTEHFKFEANHSLYPTLYGAIAAGVCKEWLPCTREDGGIRMVDEPVDRMEITIEINRVDLQTLQAIFDE